LTALKDGDFTRLMPDGQDGISGEIADTINTLVRRLNPFAAEVTRISREIGTEGLSGTWKDLVDNINLMAANLTNQVRNLSQVAERIEAGDSGRRVTVHARGETLEFKETLNRLVDQVSER
jgi:HAMP domain-containing protein